MRKESIPIIVVTVFAVLLSSFLVFSFIYAPEVVLKADDAFKTLEISPGYTFTIEMESKPGSGYTWTYTVTDNNVIQSLMNEYIPPKSSDPDKPGLHRFYFRAAARGDTTIKMKYEIVNATPPDVLIYTDFNVSVQ